MRNRRKSRGRILDQIILCQLALVLVLFLVLKVTSVEEKQETLETNLSSTPATNQLEAITMLPEQITVTPSNQNQAITQAPSITLEPTGTPMVEEPMEEPADTEEEPADTTDESAVEPTKEEDTTSNASVPAFAVGMSSEFVKTLANTKEGTILSANGIKDLVYYQQDDARWANSYYGDTDTIGEYGCAPTCLAMVVSTLSEYDLDPVQMSAWAKEKGYWYPQQGSLHSIIPEGAKSFGLTVVGAENTTGVKEKLEQALTEGKLVVALMGKGSFTRTGHFIVLRGMTEDGTVYVADPNSKENTEKTWELTQIINEAKSWAGFNGPFWIVSP